MGSGNKLRTGRTVAPPAEWINELPGCAAIMRLGWVAMLAVLLWFARSRLAGIDDVRHAVLSQTIRSPERS